MEEELILFQNYRIAMPELIKLEPVLTSIIEISNGTFIRVSIIINNITHFADNQDQTLVTIQLT